MGSWNFRYPSIPNFPNLRPTPRLLLGKRLFWTYKEDGECVCLWLGEPSWWKRKLFRFFNVLFKIKRRGNNWLIGDKVYTLHVSSRNKIDAQSDIVKRVKSSKDYPKVLELLEENPEFVCYIEECPEGLSVTRVKKYDRTYLFLFDIYNRSAERFLPYVNVHQHAFHHKIPVVELYAETRFTSMKQLLKFRQEILKHCKENNLEGMVVKTFDKTYGYVQAKVKQDTPKPKKQKIKKGEVELPPIPEGEILGAINHAHQELGDEDFKDVRKAMPLVARMVSEECKKHFYSGPSGALFHYYKEYLESQFS